MLSWLQAVLPECRVSNLTTDWNSGILLSALIEYCRPGLFPHWKTLSKIYYLFLINIFHLEIHNYHLIFQLYCININFIEIELISDGAQSVDNCRNAMSIAQKDLGIPAVLEPEYLASPWLDELSGMTYLSYFMKPGSPGYHATLRWVNSRLQKSINNFTVSL